MSTVEALPICSLFSAFFIAVLSQNSVNNGFNGRKNSISNNSVGEPSARSHLSSTHFGKTDWSAK